jgi:hypothetical protein
MKIKKRMKTKKQTGIRPAYYGPGGVYEPVNVVDAWALSFRVATALCYMARAGNKPGVSAIDDITKAQTFLGMEIRRLRKVEKKKRKEEEKLRERGSAK